MSEHSHEPATLPDARRELVYPARVGILGGGQLARMMAEAASQLGIEVSVLEREANSPAGRIAAREVVLEVVGAWTDPAKLAELAEGALAVTLENEFVDVAALEALEACGVPVFPSSRTLAAVQDKLLQKRNMQAAGIPVAAFAEVATSEDVTQAGERCGWPLILKARRNSYDGYGNATLNTPEDIAPAFARLGWPQRQLYVEAAVPFVRELAVMVARGRDGATAVYPVVETIQRNHICHVVRAPARYSGGSRCGGGADRAAGGGGDRRRRGLRRGAFETAEGACFTTRSRRARTTPATTASRGAAPRSSRMLCAPCWVCRWATSR